jgi:serine/threonine protein kinase
MNQTAASFQPSSVVVFRDGLGERRRVTDSTGRESLDLLCLTGEMIAVAAFEAAVRERTEQLTDFRHPSFCDLRGVERLSGGTVAVVADAVPGSRIADLLASAAEHHLTLDINAALCLIRQLVPAIEALHEHNREIIHGAIGIERLVVTPRARLVVVDHVLGSALEQLHYSHQRYWKDLRVALPRSAGQPKFDARVDVTQIGVVALQLILGHPLGDDEYPMKLAELVGSAWAIGGSGDLEPLKPGLRAWLTRALQLDLRNAFGSVAEAGEELDRVLASDSDSAAETASLQAFLARFEATTTPRAHASAPVPSSAAVQASSSSPAYAAPPAAAVASVLIAHPTPGPVAVPPPAVRLVPPPVASALKAYTQGPASAPSPTPALSPSPVLSTELSPAPAEAPTPAPAALAAAFAAAKKETVVPDPEFDLPQLHHEPRRPQPSVAPPVAVPYVPPPEGKVNWTRYAVAGVVLLALAVGGVMALRHRSAAGIAADTGTLSVNSNPGGAQLLVDGKLAGVTPTTLTLPQGDHTLTLRASGADPRTMTVSIAAGTQASQYIELPKAEVRAETTSGRLQVRTDPPGALVSVDSIPRGASPVTIGNLAPGDHTVVVSANGNSVQQSVTVDAGMTSALVVPLGVRDKGPLSGWVAIASPIEVQLFEGGKLVGTNQSDRIMVASGTHQLDLVNEALGYRVSRSVSVAPGKVETVTLRPPMGSIAINAIPWAEVWVDGEKAGDTPIGNLAVAIGKHEVTFRHPEFGEAHQVVTVTLSGPARLSVDLRKK